MIEWMPGWAAERRAGDHGSQPGKRARPVPAFLLFAAFFFQACTAIPESTGSMGFADRQAPKLNVTAVGTAHVGDVDLDIEVTDVDRTTFVFRLDTATWGRIDSTVLSEDLSATGPATSVQRVRLNLDPYGGRRMLRITAQDGSGNTTGTALSFEVKPRITCRYTPLDWDLEPVFIPDFQGGFHTLDGGKRDLRRWNALSWTWDSLALPIPGARPVAAAFEPSGRLWLAYRQGAGPARLASMDGLSAAPVLHAVPDFLRPADKTSVGGEDQSFLSLGVAGNGDVWALGTTSFSDRYLVRYRPSDGTWTARQVEKAEELAADRAGKVWLRIGAAIAEAGEGAPVAFPLGVEPVTRLYVDGEGQAKARTAEGFWAVRGEYWALAFAVPDQQAEDCIQDAAGTMWCVGTGEIRKYRAGRMEREYPFSGGKYFLGMRGDTLGTVGRSACKMRQAGL